MPPRRAKVPPDEKVKKPSKSKGPAVREQSPDAKSTSKRNSSPQDADEWMNNPFTRVARKGPKADAPKQSTSKQNPPPMKKKRASTWTNDDEDEDEDECPPNLPAAKTKSKQSAENLHSSKKRKNSGEPETPAKKLKTTKKNQSGCDDEEEEETNQKPGSQLSKGDKMNLGYTDWEINRFVRVSHTTKGPITPDWMMKTQHPDILKVLKGRENYQNLHRTRGPIYWFFNKHRKNKNNKNFHSWKVDYDHRTVSQTALETLEEECREGRGRQGEGH